MIEKKNKKKQQVSVSTDSDLNKSSKFFTQCSKGKKVGAKLSLF